MDPKDELKKRLLLAKAKIYDLKSKKLLADTGSPGEKKPAEDLSVPKDTSAPAAQKTEAEYAKPKKGQRAFALAIQGGHLIGPAGKDAACPECVSRHLTERNVSNRPVDLADVKTSKHLVDEVSGQNRNPHLFHEIMGDGTTTPLLAALERHPDCKSCKTPPGIRYPKAKQTNFAFTSCKQLQCSRFGTPEGNLWLSQATSRDGKVTHGVAPDRDTARFNAVEGKAPGESGHPDFIPEIGKEAAEHKQGHLVVGANNYLRNKLPFFLLQQYDHHIVHHQDEHGTHHVGVIALHRQHPDHSPVVTHASGETGEKALTGALHQQLIEARPVDHDEDHNPISGQKSGDPHQSKKNTWLTHWIYRQPKKSLKDLLTSEEPKMAKSMELEPGQSILEKAKIYEFGSGKLLADNPKPKPASKRLPRYSMADLDHAGQHEDAMNMHLDAMRAEYDKTGGEDNDATKYHKLSAQRHKDAIGKCPGCDLKEQSKNDLNKAGDKHVFHVNDKLDSCIHYDPDGGKWTTSYKDTGGKRRHREVENIEHAVAHIENVHGAKIDTSSPEFKSFQEKTSGLNKAKIYSYENKELLADLPSEPTPRRAKVKSPEDFGDMSPGRAEHTIWPGGKDFLNLQNSPQTRELKQKLTREHKENETAAQYGMNPRELNTERFHYHLGQWARHRNSRDEHQRLSLITVNREAREKLDTDIQNHSNAMKAHLRRAKSIYQGGHENLLGTEYEFETHMADHLRRTQEMARQKKFVPHHSEKKPKAPKGDPGEVA